MSSCGLVGLTRSFRKHSTRPGLAASSLARLTRVEKASVDEEVAVSAAKAAMTCSGSNGVTSACISAVMLQGRTNLVDSGKLQVNLMQETTLHTDVQLAIACGCFNAPTTRSVARQPHPLQWLEMVLAIPPSNLS